MGVSLGVFIAVGKIQSLDPGLRSHKPHGKASLQKNATETTGHQHAKTSKINSRHGSYILYKKKPKWITDLNLNHKTTKTIHLLYVQDNIEKNLGGPWVYWWLGIVQHQGHEKTSLINWN